MSKNIALANTYKKVALKEVGKIISGSTPDSGVSEYWNNGTIPWITPADLTEHEGVFFEGSLRKITEKGYKSCSATMLPPYSILFSSRAPIGHCAVTKYPLCTNQGFKSIVPNGKLDPIYGFFALKYFTPEIELLGRGATFTEVNKEIIENFEIPLPPLAEQQRIAAILQKADRIRRLRRYARQLSDTFLQSVFLEMFGDPATNTRNWKVKQFQEFCTKIGDGTHFSPPEVPIGRPYITSKNIRTSGIDLRNLTYVSEENFREIYKRCDPKPEDVLYVKDGVNAGVAKVNNLQFKFAMLSSVALLRLDQSQMIPLFFEHHLNFPSVYNYISSLIQGGAIKRLTLEKIKELTAIVPPVELQIKFSQRAIVYERLFAQQAESSRQAEHLFQSLLQRAFRGEL